MYSNHEITLYAQILNEGYASQVCVAFMFLFFTQTTTAVSIDSCRICVLYKYYIATKDREHKNVTDSVLSILEIGDSITKYGDLTRYAYTKRNVPEAIKNIMVDMLTPTSTHTHSYFFSILRMIL